MRSGDRFLAANSSWDTNTAIHHTNMPAATWSSNSLRARQQGCCECLNSCQQTHNPLQYLQHLRQVSQQPMWAAAEVGLCQGTAAEGQVQQQQWAHRLAQQGGTVTPAAQQ